MSDGLRRGDNAASTVTTRSGGHGGSHEDGHVRAVTTRRANFSALVVSAIQREPEHLTLGRRASSPDCTAHAGTVTLNRLGTGTLKAHTPSKEAGDPCAHTRLISLPHQPSPGLGTAGPRCRCTHRCPRWQTARASGPRRAGPPRLRACAPASRGRRSGRSRAWTCAGPRCSCSAPPLDTRGRAHSGPSAQKGVIPALPPSLGRGPPEECP